MSKTIFPLFQTIREAATTPVWSQGARLARTGGVHGISEDAEEIVLRVHVPGLLVAPTVVLYPEDEDWECDCQSRDEACAHVAAAAIALERAREEGERLPSSKMEQTRVVYSFELECGGLILDRSIETADGSRYPLTTPLMSQVGSRAFPHGLRPTQADFGVDRIIGRALRVRKPLLPGQLPGIFKMLEGNSSAFLSGQTIQISSEPLLPTVIVSDGPEGGISLHVDSLEAQIEVIAPGVAKKLNTLHYLGAQDLDVVHSEQFKSSRSYAKAELGEFASSVLPELQCRVNVTVKTARIPEISRLLRPRIAMEMDQQGDTLTVLPLLVYGSPPTVRIEGDKMVYLGGSVPARDKTRERELVHRLRDEMNLAPGRRAVFSGKEAMRFIDSLSNLGTSFLDSSQRVIQTGGQLLPKVDIVDDLFKVTFVLERDRGEEDGLGQEEMRFAEAHSVISAWQEGLGVAPLLGGGFGPIPSDWLDRHGHLIADLLAARGEDGRISTAAIPLLRELTEELEMPAQPCFDRLAPLLEDFRKIPRSDLPSDLQGILRDYQRQGVDWLRFLKRAGLGAILADDMGLGKTLEALCTIEGRTLVICPTSVLSNWTAEIDRFRPGLTWSVFHGPGRVLDADADVVLTTYAILRIDRDILSHEQWDAVILDEAQNIKNPDSQAARAAYGLSGSFHLALSGTPVENRLMELFSLFHFCNPGLLGSRSHFKKRFEEPIELGDEPAAQQLGKRIRPFVLRRLKGEVATELPPRTDQAIRVELEGRDLESYQAVRAAANREIVEALRKGGSVMAAFEALLRLRQACCHRGLLPGEEADSSAKIELLLERLDITLAGGHKALVFSQWTSFLDRIEPHLCRAGIEFTRLDGTTKNRGAVVESFQAVDGPPVMLISLRAGGTGLNLTQADHVFIMDPWWNPAVEDQAADRTHRIGQERPVMVYHIIAQDTVEERILVLQKKKRRLADAALGRAGEAASLTREDLLSLLDYAPL